jgi:NADP-dependent 3-hydroxy acid dehydrogenase YdfG
MAVNTTADMTGQVALVTGEIRGIGLAICGRLMNRGITVAAGYAGRHDHAQQFAGKYAGHGVSIHQGNIDSNEDCVRVIGEILDRHGQLDILVRPSTPEAGLNRQVDRRVREGTVAPRSLGVDEDVAAQTRRARAGSRSPTHWTGAA